MIVVKFGCQLILLIVFVYQIIKSLNKLEHGELGTSILEESVSSHQLPTITICRIPTMRKIRRVHEISIEKAYHEMGIEDRRIIHRLSIGNTGSLEKLNALKRNYMDPNNPLNLEPRIEVHNTYLPMEGELNPCESVTISKNISLSELVLLEFTPSTSDWNTLIAFDDQQQFISMGNEVLGGTQIPGTYLLPERSSLCSLHEKVMSSKSRSDRICDETSQTKMFKCAQDYQVRNMPCHLPWSSVSEDSQKRPCNETQDWSVWKNLSDNLYQDITYAKIVKTTGCVPNCVLRKYEAKLVSGSFPLISDQLLNSSHTLLLHMPQGIVTVQTEKHFYDTSSFIADIGGFLGLLLGLSVMDIVDVVLSIIKRVAETIFKTKLDPVS